MEGLIILAAIYFLPTLIAMSRKRDNTGAIFALNLFAGWTFIGWLVAMVWAATMDRYESDKRKSKFNK